MINKVLQKTGASALGQRARSSAGKFKQEFKKHTVTAITAAFAFLIALAWKDPITELVNSIIKNLNLTGGAIYYRFLAAFLITAIAVVFLILLSRWSAKND